MRTLYFWHDLVALILIFIVHIFPAQLAWAGTATPPAVATKAGIIESVKDGIISATGSELIPSEVAKMATTSAVAEQMPIGSLTDPELTTYELTNIALSMLLKRVEVQESTLNAESRTAATDRLDPAAERASLEGLLQQNVSVAGGDSAPNSGRVEGARLDLKILQSRRDLLQYRAGNIESKISEITELLGQNEGDLNEGRRLEEEWRARKTALDAVVAPDKKALSTVDAALVELKRVSLATLLVSREKHLAALGRVRKLLQERMKTLREEQNNAREILTLAGEFVGRFTASLRVLEEQADRINLRIQEKRAQEGLDQGRRDQEALLTKLEELDKSLLETHGNGSSSSAVPPPWTNRSVFSRSLSATHCLPHVMRSASRYVISSCCCDM
ncbi:MAG: hypothetical protein HQM09_16735 [Candidatus Riflebacteria bacterium]|nr:hypothetical protein [Candidatus Riflebacteria bacterium]